MVMTRDWSVLRAGWIFGIPTGLVWGLVFGGITYVGSQLEPGDVVFTWMVPLTAALIGALAVGLPSMLLYAVLRAGGFEARHPSITRTALAAGLIAGLTLGIGARAAMRVMVIAEGKTPAFSWGGTLGIIILFGLMLGPACAVLFAGVQRWIPARGVWKGVLVGLILFVLLAVMVSPGSEVGDAKDLRPLAVALFAPLLIVYGLIVARIVPNPHAQVSEPRTPQPTQHARG
jgi:hypothetical protein